MKKYVMIFTIVWGIFGGYAEGIVSGQEMPAEPAPAAPVISKQEIRDYFKLAYFCATDELLTEEELKEQDDDPLKVLEEMEREYAKLQNLSFDNREFEYYKEKNMEWMEKCYASFIGIVESVAALEELGIAYENLPESPAAGKPFFLERWTVSFGRMASRQIFQEKY